MTSGLLVTRLPEGQEQSPRTSARESGYRPALDGLRAVAVGSVVAYHFGWRALPGGFLGVDVFFVLSGYLITSILLAEHAGTGALSMSRFYSRRLRRLFPALALVIVAVSVDTARHGNPIQLGDRFHDMIAAVFYYANWHFIASDQSYFAGAAGASPLRHTWSLSIEEQFYFVWPLLLLVLLRTVTLARRRQLAVGLAGLTLLSAVAMAATFDPAAPSRAYYGSDGRAQQLLVGVLLAVGLHGVKRSARAVRAWSAIGAGALVALLLVMHGLTDQSPLYYRGGALAVALVTAVLIAALERQPETAVGRLMSVAPLAWIGKISYGVYLWHWPVMLWVHGTVLRVLVTVGLSAASFYLYERPIREGRLRWVGKSASRTAIAFGVVAACVVGTAYAATRPPSMSSDPIAAEAGHRALQPCKDLTHPCVRVDGGPTAPVMASIGDSTMEGYDTALQLIAKDRGLTYLQAAVPGCPISLRPVRSGPHGTQTERDKLCEQVTPASYDELVRTRRARLFIGTAVREFLPSEDADGNTLATGSPEHLAVVQAGLERAMTRLTSGGATVVLVHILPRGAEPSCLSVRTSHEPRCTTDASADVNAAIYNRIFDEVAARHPSQVKVVDLTDLVCPSGRCPVVVDGRTMRGDQLHLTREASAWLAPFLVERMRKVGVPLPT